MFLRSSQVVVDLMGTPWAMLMRVKPVKRDYGCRDKKVFCHLAPFRRILAHFLIGVISHTSSTEV